MSRDPGDIPVGLPGRADLVEALARAGDMPVEALEAASLSPGRIAPDVLRVVERAASGEAPTEREANLLFWGIHVLAAARDERLFHPLIRLLRRDPDEVVSLLGPAVTETLPRVAASVFDGDVDALEAAIVEGDADEFVRWSLFGSYAFLTFDGRIARARAHAFLERFERDRPGRPGDGGWAGWEQAVALLGFDEFEPAVSEARRSARLLGDEDDIRAFAETLASAKAQPDQPGRFFEQGLGYVGDPVDELFAALDEAEGEDEAATPLRNPLRDVGRNDPCPCGSGRKFKKCCLAGGMTGED